MLRITPQAAEELSKYLKEQKEGSVIRLQMAGYG